jgi:hypothetical protein
MQPHCFSHDKRLLLPDVSKASNDFLKDIQKRGKPEEKKDCGRPNDAPAGFLAELQSRKAKAVEGEDEKENNVGHKVTLGLANRVKLEKFSPGVEKLERFLSDAEHTLKSLKDKEKFTIETCRVSLM